MSAELNKNLVRRIFDEAINKGNTNAYHELVGSTFINHSFPQAPRGPEGLNQIIGMFRTAFPNMKVLPQEIIAEGDRVVTQGTAHGTHQGEFMGIPATGKEINFNYIDIWRIENGKAVENWVQMDTRSMMQQLGAIPPTK